MAGVRRTWAVAATAALGLVVVAIALAGRSDGDGSRQIAVGGGAEQETNASLPTRPSLIRLTSGDLTVDLVDTPAPGGATCVTIRSVDRTERPAAPPACNTGNAGLEIQSVTMARRTVVYGIGHGITSVSGSAQQVATADQDEVQVDDALAFVQVWSVPDADGIVFATSADPQQRSFTGVFGAGLADFEPDPPEPLPVDLPLTGRMLFAFKHQGQIWAILESGSNVRLTGGRVTGHPTVAPDGRTIVFPRTADAVFDDLIALDVLTSAERSITAAGTAAFAPDGRLAIAPPFDDDVTVEVAIHAPGSFAKSFSVPLEQSARIGGVMALAWSADGKSLLVTTTQGRDLWMIDLASRRARVVGTPGAPADSTWAIGRGDGEGFPVIRVGGYGVEIGRLTIEGDVARFRGAPLDLATPEAKLDTDSTWTIAPVGKTRAEMVGDAHFTFRPGDEEAYLVSDNQEIFLATASGTLTYLLSDAKGPSAF